MKKILYLIFIYFLSITFLYAKEINIGTYSVLGKSFDVTAEYSETKVLNVFIDVSGEYKNDKVSIRIEGENDIKAFIESLRQCKIKFIEWKQVVKNNNIKEITKAMDVTFPNVQIWWRGSSWHRSYKGDYIKPVFIHPTFFIGILGEATDKDNEYITQEFYMVLDDLAINSLIKVLNIEQIKNIIEKENNKELLFK